MFRNFTMMAAAFALFALAAPSASADYKPREHYSKAPDYAPYAGPRKKASRHARKYGEPGVEDYVVTESIGRVKQVAAPVRIAPLGYQVRLPGGTWVYCEYSCEYTLRRNTVEFWDGQGNGTFVSPGRFRKDFYLD